jgi:hypothetical protein
MLRIVARHVVKHADQGRGVEGALAREVVDVAEVKGRAVPKSGLLDAEAGEVHHRLRRVDSDEAPCRAEARGGANLKRAATRADNKDARFGLVLHGCAQHARRQLVAGLVPGERDPALGVVLSGAGWVELRG